ncbi:hypothetical protein L873DRAFT_1307136 [Choiromyces venosus 120613-1]|uniref:Uncharacterized protein n=1 Tax=Choiromyces venosus 120613-1 TaxID=1336337 RepID=A0A3N4JGN5_9PEZI|nr:hypothetical protein L873DRAFT_1307136 [Choiromyces venosus 120613-1]
MSRLYSNCTRPILFLIFFTAAARCCLSYTPFVSPRRDIPRYYSSQLLFIMVYLTYLLTFSHVISLLLMIVLVIALFLFPRGGYLLLYKSSAHRPAPPRMRTQKKKRK